MPWTREDRYSWLERIVHTASKIIGSDLKPIASTHSLLSDCKVMAIVQDTLHPANHLFQPLPSGCKYRAMRAWASRFQKSFYPQVMCSFSMWSLRVRHSQRTKLCSVFLVVFLKDFFNIPNVHCSHVCICVCVCVWACIHACICVLCVDAGVCVWMCMWVKLLIVMF